jgi:hypothetical protein
MAINNANFSMRPINRCISIAVKLLPGLEQPAEPSLLLQRSQPWLPQVDNAAVNARVEHS